jgi:hypothetical protein
VPVCAAAGVPAEPLILPHDLKRIPTPVATANADMKIVVVARRIDLDDLGAAPNDDDVKADHCGRISHKVRVEKLHDRIDIAEAAVVDFVVTLMSKGDEWSRFTSTLTIT